MKLIKILMSILSFCLCVTACSSQQINSSMYDASAQPTPTPNEKITDIPKIVEILNQLAKKNVGMYQKQGWWFRSNTVVSQSGDLYSSDHEEWSYLPQDPSKCLVRMDISKDPSSSEIALWQMQTQEGYMGELISLRQGTSEVMQVDQAVCRLTVDVTEAGYLAKSLQGSASSKDSRGTLEFANAWYEEREGKQVFVIYAGFKTPFEKLISQTEGYSFDLQSGMALDHFLYMGWQDGSEMGKTETQSRYELWEELPGDVAILYEQAAKELKSYVNVPSNISKSAAPTMAPIDLEAIMEPYTKDNPLTDETQLIAVVREVMQRQTAWMTQPGWLLQKQLFVPGKDFTREQYTLVHITSEDGTCQEQMVYFFKDGILSPWIVRTADGMSGNLNSLNRSSQPKGQIEQNSICSLKDGESVFVDGDFLLVDEANTLRSFIADKQNGLIKGDVKAWLDVMDNNPVFVLAYHHEHDPADNRMVMNPNTQELEGYTQSNQLKYFDMETGTPVWNIENFTLESGLVTDFDGGMHYSWDSFSELPQELEQAYIQAENELKLTLSGE